MKTEALTKKELFTGIEEAVSQLSGLMSSLDENKVNAVPYENSWTPAQLLQHVIKSTNGMTKAIQAPPKPADRDSNEKIPMLQKVFLDLSSKLNAPDFIIPGEGPFENQVSIDELERSFEELKKHAADAELSDIVDLPPLGQLTKSEILHFVLYHTQRHLHQMKRICTALIS